MKKTSKKSKKLVAEDRTQAEQWIGLLEASSMFHLQVAKETQIIHNVLNEHGSESSQAPFPNKGKKQKKSEKYEKT